MKKNWIPIIKNKWIKRSSFFHFRNENWIEPHGPRKHELSIETERERVTQ